MINKLKHRIYKKRDSIYPDCQCNCGGYLVKLKMIQNCDGLFESICSNCRRRYQYCGGWWPIDTREDF